MGQHVRSNALQGKTVDQHRHNDHAAANTEQASQRTGKTTQNQIQQKFHRHLDKPAANSRKPDSPIVYSFRHHFPAKAPK